MLLGVESIAQRSKTIQLKINKTEAMNAFNFENLRFSNFHIFTSRDLRKKQGSKSIRQT